MQNVDLAKLKKQGFIKQREGDYFTIRLKILAGNITADQMVGLSDVANKYGRGYVGLTTRLGVEIPWIKIENLEKARDELQKIDLKPGGTGPTVRAIVACKGTICAHGLINTQRLCSMLDTECFGKILPSKFKMGIAGCPNNCAKVQLNDIGFMGQCRPQLEESLCEGCLACVKSCPSGAIEKIDVKVCIDDAKCIMCGKCINTCPVNAVSVNKQGVALFIGGKFGRNYRIGERLGPILSIHEAMVFTKIIIAFYEDNAKPGERFGETVNRIGIESVRASLMILYGRSKT
ncbi:MAG TPA: 4Fe-4S binding protein [Deltaproteobacteria bacterium]|nr:4Fe-4S binding protein [Deltaproteobacteria bacterium]HPJ93945.1 4Fe-4S binding protein [Deltaproteobacteria bacterium]HPR51332.1 4Fe-4S binding protein [Deltaproteobacteria bacterium]